MIAAREMMQTVRRMPDFSLNRLSLLSNQAVLGPTAYRYCSKMLGYDLARQTSIEVIAPDRVDTRFPLVNCGLTIDFWVYGRQSECSEETPTSKVAKPFRTVVDGWLPRELLQQAKRQLSIQTGVLYGHRCGTTWAHETGNSTSEKTTSIFQAINLIIDEGS